MLNDVTPLPQGFVRQQPTGIGARQRQGQRWFRGHKSDSRRVSQQIQHAPTKRSGQRVSKLLMLSQALVSNRKVLTHLL